MKSLEEITTALREDIYGLAVKMRAPIGDIIAATVDAFALNVSPYFIPTIRRTSIESRLETVLPLYHKYRELEEKYWSEIRYKNIKTKPTKKTEPSFLDKIFNKDYGGNYGYFYDRICCLVSGTGFATQLALFPLTIPTLIFTNTASGIYEFFKNAKDRRDLQKFYGVKFSSDRRERQGEVAYLEGMISKYVSGRMLEV